MEVRINHEPSLDMAAPSTAPVLLRNGHLLLHDGQLLGHLDVLLRRGLSAAGPRCATGDMGRGCGSQETELGDGVEEHDDYCQGCPGEINNLG